MWTSLGQTAVWFGRDVGLGQKFELSCIQACVVIHSILAFRVTKRNLSVVLAGQGGYLVNMQDSSVQFNL